ncbi:MAG: zf-HC2 domain-containing protein [Candidatus Eisenbacteria bacterium]|uniref:Zf-HC2 domain-containing protein n=1 Tax=Eiseniibacteriota bacterium TaxID=2212470 RepID=A0A937XBG6_UNCEI|nr:zf-HC2 domain-containing protein [Candidatus Eisenbacteria bacterium]
MNHDPARDLLQDYLDAALDEARALDVEAHLRECPACRDELEALRALLRAAAALPRRVEPPRDLWPEIAARALGRASGAAAASGAGSERPAPPASALAPQGPRGLAGARRGAQRAWSKWRQAWGEWRRIGAEWRQAWRGLWPVFAGTVAVLVILLSSIFRQQEQEYLMAAPTIADLLAAECSEPERVLAAYEVAGAGARSDAARLAGESPDPAGTDGAESGALSSVLAENLAIIDRAITDARRAYEANPDSPQLIRLLAAAYRARAALTSRAAETAARS